MRISSNSEAAGLLLSAYNRYILDQVIRRLKTDSDLNIYELVEKSVSFKCILPSQNELIMETYYTISEFLVNNGFVTEQKEMVSYSLTNKGIQLRNCGTLRKYERRGYKGMSRSCFGQLLTDLKRFFFQKYRVVPPPEYYE